jgi:hypothetical protein
MIGSTVVGSEDGRIDASRYLPATSISDAASEVVVSTNRSGRT